MTANSLQDFSDEVISLHVDGGPILDEQLALPDQRREIERHGFRSCQQAPHGLGVGEEQPGLALSCASRDELGAEERLADAGAARQQGGAHGGKPPLQHLVELGQTEASALARRDEISSSLRRLLDPGDDRDAALGDVHHMLTRQMRAPAQLGDLRSPDLAPGEAHGAE